jgi:hypothetical protein
MDGGAPGPQSFDFERLPVAAAPVRPVEPAAPPRPAEPAAPPRAVEPAPVVPQPRPEWTPTPPSDATREGPRSEP